METKLMPSAKIEKTRREPRQFAPTAAAPRGVMQPVEDRGGSYFHQRLMPPAPLASLVQHFWFVQWDLRKSAPSVAETLPHPSCYLVFEHDLESPINDLDIHRRAEVSGVTTGKFSRCMDGHKRVFGVKFQPGGLRPFLQHSATTLTDRIVPASEIFGAGVLRLASQLRALDTPEQMAETASGYFIHNWPPPDGNVETVRKLVGTILHDATMLTVEAVSRESGLSVRSLQRLFREYVGVSPKWVIRRFRLHELLERLKLGEAFEGAQVALDLGYADQAHLINDFRQLTGCTPVEYLKRAVRAGGDAKLRRTP